MSQHITAEQRALRAASSLRIASVPAAHAYVQASTADGRLFVLDDPRPAGAPAGRWWPPVMLDATWIERNQQEFDLFHVHFGFESFTVGQLTETVETLERAGRPLVLTVHDLENPQLGDQALYRQQLGVLVEAADELITLTPGAAAEIGARWGREATVIPHPRMLTAASAEHVHGRSSDTAPSTSADTAARTSAGASAGASARTSSRIGLHLRDLRPNIDALHTVRLLLEAAHQLGAEGLPVTVVVDINDRVRDEPARDAVRAEVEGSPLAEWHEHPRFTDDELAESIAGLDVEVLPYRHGTHSGWLELCWDLGVAVLAPEHGFYAQQHLDDSVAVFDRRSAVSLTDKLRLLLGRPHDPGSRRELSHTRLDARSARDRHSRAALLDVYDRALSRVCA